MTKLSGEEHVTVFNRLTGKRLSGADGPKLKNLAQWFIENDQYEVDPKWAEEMGEKFSRPESKRKGPGRPPLDDTPTRAGKTGSPGIGPSYNSMASLGIDPKNPMAALAALDPKNPSSLAALYGLDPMLLAAFGMDPRNPKLDPMMAAALGLDPKNPKFDPMVLASMGLDPKNPNSTILAAMAAMDPTGQQIAAMYGMGAMGAPGFPGMPGMDLYGKGKHSPTSKDKNPAPSPRSSQRDGPSPRPPSRASVSSKDGKDGRSTPSRSSVGPSSAAQPSPKPPSSAASTAAGMFGGLDPKVLSTMDPKLLQ